VARAFAREGARAFLAGRTEAPLVAVADAIRAAGGRADVALVDALDEAAVNAHADAVVAESGSLDITFNVINHGDVQGTPLADMALADFEAPVGGLHRAGGVAPAAGNGVGRLCIRVLTLQTGGIPESRPDDVEYAKAIEEDITGRTMLGRAATLADVGNVAAFAASDPGQLRHRRQAQHQRGDDGRLTAAGNVPGCPGHPAGRA
jgi:3-oxoacyl-[acyl-carrier protein] reductase